MAKKKTCGHRGPTRAPSLIIMQPGETMRAAIASGRVTYTANWLQDCVFYLCNNHVLLAVFFAHADHPYGRLQRGLVLFNSVAFAFFITSVLEAAMLIDAVRGILKLSVGMVLQLLFDVPASMLGTCPCAHSCLPPPIQAVCKGAAMLCLSLHTCIAVVLAFLGFGAMAVNALFGGDVDSQLVWDSFVQTKVSAWVSAVPTAILMFMLLRECEKSAAAQRSMV